MTDIFAMHLLIIFCSHNGNTVVQVYNRSPLNTVEKSAKNQRKFCFLHETVPFWGQAVPFLGRMPGMDETNFVRICSLQ